MVNLEAKGPSIPIVRDIIGDNRPGLEAPVDADVQNFLEHFASTSPKQSPKLIDNLAPTKDVGLVDYFSGQRMSTNEIINVTNSVKDGSPAAKEIAEAPTTGNAFVYRWWSTGGEVGWENAPTGGITYRCSLLAKNLDNGTEIWITTDNYNWPNPNDLLFYFEHDFRGYFWEIVGYSPAVPNSSACEAIGPYWGDHDEFDNSVFGDFRHYIYYTPIVLGGR